MIAKHGTTPCLAANVSASQATESGPETPALTESTFGEAVPVKSNNVPSTVTNNDEGFIDESDCDCDTRNFCQDSENRVPFQYCFNCAPFHPSNGRGPTLVGPQSSSTCVLPQPVTQEQEDKLIYDMDSKSTRNQSEPQSTLKRKRQISTEETQDAITSILPKKQKEADSSEGEDLNDSGFQEESEVNKFDIYLYINNIVLFFIIPCLMNIANYFLFSVIPSSIPRSHTQQWHGG